jgi:hypothetical protein
MTASDYLADAMETFKHAELDTPTYLTSAALLGIGQQLRRIADQMEPAVEKSAVKADRFLAFDSGPHRFSVGSYPGHVTAMWSDDVTEWSLDAVELAHLIPWLIAAATRIEAES